ncbi:hypothetical protein [Crocosphaera sp. XPORK-15E]|uniref:hypothetical protein n=1 Tax=Crocosphaera sp. XPORK-15E TaxID=3110247 RepID=UPI002B217BDB|nr:hypothetical protein [Crocosphaera sp. XPORK-15E]MEA5533288.1 hypothetical protein [Crocosphaera sp. XPORK-15E]
MKNILATTFSGLVTLSFLALTISPQANALSSNFKTETISPSSPQSIVSDSSSETLTAAVYCENQYINGVWYSCCIDSYGNWACVPF